MPGALVLIRQQSYLSLAAVSILHRTALMRALIQPFSVAPRPVLVAMLGFLPLGWAPASAQTPRPPAGIPYLIYPVPSFPPNPLATAPAAVPTPQQPPGPPSHLDDLKQRDQELAAIRAE